ncbi:MAG: hypothetical protein EAX96_09200 [Candidatus Lokiarchaeota archaeon]|nr:hypothetical protein [Candidatus Lokiarchaeota archaeon]
MKSKIEGLCLEEKKESEEKILTFTEVRDILKEREATEVELGYIQRKTLDYVLKFTKLSNEDTQKLLNILTGDKFNIKKKLAVQIVNLQYKFPETIEEIDLIFDKSDEVLTEEKKIELLEVLKEYKELAEMK